MQLIRNELVPTLFGLFMGDGNYNVKMKSGTNPDGTKWVECRIDNINANYGLSKPGKSDKVAFGRVFFKDSNYKNVTVQLLAYRTPPTK